MTRLPELDPDERRALEEVIDAALPSMRIDARAEYRMWPGCPRAAVLSFKIRTLEKIREALR